MVGVFVFVLVFVFVFVFVLVFVFVFVFVFVLVFAFVFVKHEGEQRRMETVVRKISQEALRASRHWWWGLVRPRQHS